MQSVQRETTMKGLCLGLYHVGWWGLDALGVGRWRSGETSDSEIGRGGIRERSPTGCVTDIVERFVSM
jgi:hypothetical protein